MTDHSKISPLPWKVAERTVFGGMADSDEIRIRDAKGSTISDCDNYFGQGFHNSAYLVRAANAYPKLVEALKRGHTDDDGAICGQDWRQPCESCAALREAGEIE